MTPWQQSNPSGLNAKMIYSYRLINVPFMDELFPIS